MICDTSGLLAAFDRTDTAHTEALRAFGPPDLQRPLEIDQQFADLGIGVTDASLVVLAARYGTRDILTLGHRHFRQLVPLQGGHFRLLPGY